MVRVIHMFSLTVMHHGQDNPYVLVNCYAPNTETGQIKTFQDLANHLSDLDVDPECNYIFGGDWNLIFNTTIDSRGGG